MKKMLNWLFDYPNLKIYQYQEGFKFSLDSILLAEYAVIKQSDEQIIDLCTGNAVIPMILNYKYQKKITGIEIQEEIFDLGNNSIHENHMENDINLICDSVLNVKNYFPGNNFDVVLSNPPYFKYYESSIINKNDLKTIARHEVCLSLSELMEQVDYLLKDNGRFYLVHVPDRMDEVIILAYQHHLVVKNMQLIYSDLNKEPILVLFTFVKGGHFGCKIGKPIAIQSLKTYQNLFHK